VVFSKTFAHCTMPEDGEGYPAYTPFILIDESGSLPVGCYYSPQIPTNYQDHGTHVAGRVGANKDFAVTVGVAPGIPLLSYKVFERLIFLHADGTISEDFGADDFNIWRAIDDASSKGVSVINMSLGGNLDRNNRDQNTHILAWDRVVRAATKRGTVVVAAAGNDNANLNGTLTSIPSDLPSVISVGATGTSTLIGPQGLDALPGSDVRAEYSNVGAAVDIAAPGGDCGPGGFNPDCNVPNLILSPIIVPLGIGLPPGTPSWAWNAGTSMASPHVAGAAALVKAKHPEFSPADVKERLKATAQKVGSRQHFGAGIVDAAAATAN
jgi:subtilisin family serine protease